MDLNNTVISVLHNKKTEINWGSNKLADPKIIAELFKSYFIEIVEEMTIQWWGIWNIPKDRGKIKYMCGNHVLQASIKRRSRKCYEVKKF